MNTLRYLLGVDLGTSGTKTVLFTEEGKAVASALIEYPLYQPKNGWSEQDPEDWWAAARDTIREVIAKSKVSAEDICGLAISGQMHGLVLLDENTEVVRRALIWNDGRTQEACDEIHRIIGREKLISICGNPALTGFTAGKIVWVQHEEPENWARVRHIMLPKDYVRFRLTGVIKQEISDASGTNLLDIHTREWSDEILQALHIDKTLLPALCGSTEQAGNVTAKAAQETGLKAGMPVAGGGGDNMCAAVGTGVVKPGSAFTTIGTSGVVYMHSDRLNIHPEGRFHAFISAIPGEYVNLACTLSAGFSLRWFRNQFCQAEIQAAEEMGVDSYNLMNQEAVQSPIGANRLLFLPYLMGERSPLMDNNARGAFIGLNAMHTRRDLLRAVMEGVTYALRQNLDTLSENGIRPARMLACGGGAKSPVWCDMMANTYHMPVTTLENSEGPALGAAILAGVCCGIYSDVPSACEKLVHEKAPVMPQPDTEALYEQYYQLFLKLYPCMKDAFAKLQTLPC